MYVRGFHAKLSVTTGELLLVVLQANVYQTANIACQCPFLPARRLVGRFTLEVSHESLVAGILGGKILFHVFFHGLAAQSQLY